VLRNFDRNLIGKENNGELSNTENLSSKLKDLREEKVEEPVVEKEKP
jgi:hypothetical protein